MLGSLKVGFGRRRTGQQLYEGIVALSREPVLYESCGVPDTMEGRLEMLLLHTVVVLERLKSEGADGQRIGQRLMEHLVADIDDCLRRIGLGDDSVAPRIQKLGGAIGERARDYGAALGATDAALETALIDHVWRPADASAATAVRPWAQRLAARVRSSRSALDSVRLPDLAAGRLGRSSSVPAAPETLEQPL